MVTSARLFLTAALIAVPFLWTTNVLADAPVTTLAASSETVSSSSQANANSSTATMSPEQRLRVLENKLQFLENAQVVQTVAQLRDRMQSLQGNLDVQSHDLQQLKKQQTDFYRDIDRRIAQLSGSKTNTKLADATPHPNETAPAQAKASTAIATAAPVPAPADIATAPKKAAAPALQAKEVAADIAPKVIASPSIVPAVTTLSEQQTYEQAYRLIINHRFADATKALQQFIEQFPNSHYSANAHYWLGELYFHERDLANAQQEFVLVTTQYPQNVKAADCLYKLGMIARLQNDLPTARRYFQDILKRFPESKVATLAGSQLHRMA
jgi:tol-pal system protein YbgF